MLPRHHSCIEGGLLLREGRTRGERRRKSRGKQRKEGRRKEKRGGRKGEGLRHGCWRMDATVSGNHSNETIYSAIERNCSYGGPKMGCFIYPSAVKMRHDGATYAPPIFSLTSVAQVHAISCYVTCTVQVLMSPKEDITSFSHPLLHLGIHLSDPPSKFLHRWPPHPSSCTKQHSPRISLVEHRVTEDFQRIPKYLK